jgi:hypothetical protein
MSGCRQDASPAWNFVSVSSGSGDKTCWNCKFCSKAFKSGGSRVYSHIAQVAGGGIAACTGGASKEAHLEARKELRQWKQAKEDTDKQKKDRAEQQKVADGNYLEGDRGTGEGSGGPAQRSETAANDTDGGGGTGAAGSNAKQAVKSPFTEAAGNKPKEMVQTRIDLTPNEALRGMNKKNKVCKATAKDVLDEKIAKFMYAEGVPFHKAESEEFKAMIAAAVNFGQKSPQEAKDYAPPSRWRLSTTLLDEQVLIACLQWRRKCCEMSRQ